MKQRLDLLLVDRGLLPSREKAKSVIMAGLVYVDGQKEDKPGSMFQTEAKIEVRGQTNPYVSRGGLKLEKALETFDVSVEDCVCMDVGASTGGFTDCLLQHGAAKVYAIDVGKGQLDWKLRQDPRVICMEKRNARYLKPSDIGEPIDLSTVDVSFISLTKVLVPIRECLRENGQAVALIKPQFEAGREKVGKKGVVREPDTHVSVIKKIADFASEKGFVCLALTFSPIKGPEGNIEYLLHLRKSIQGKTLSENLIEKTVDKAFTTLSQTEQANETEGTSDQG